MVRRKAKKLQFWAEDTIKVAKIFPKMAVKDIKEKRLRRKPEHFLEFPDYVSWRSKRKKELDIT